MKLIHDMAAILIKLGWLEREARTLRCCHWMPASVVRGRTFRGLRVMMRQLMDEFLAEELGNEHEDFSLCFDDTIDSLFVGQTDMEPYLPVRLDRLWSDHNASKLVKIGMYGYKYACIFALSKALNELSEPGRSTLQMRVNENFANRARQMSSAHATMNALAKDIALPSTSIHECIDCCRKADDPFQLWDQLVALVCAYRLTLMNRQRCYRHKGKDRGGGRYFLEMRPVEQQA